MNQLEQMMNQAQSVSAEPILIPKQSPQYDEFIFRLIRLGQEQDELDKILKKYCEERINDLHYNKIKPLWKKFEDKLVEDGLLKRHPNHKMKLGMSHDHKLIVSVPCDNPGCPLCNKEKV